MPTAPFAASGTDLLPREQEEERGLINPPGQFMARPQDSAKGSQNHAWGKSAEPTRRHDATGSEDSRAQRSPPLRGK